MPGQFRKGQWLKRSENTLETVCELINKQKTIKTKAKIRSLDAITSM